MNKFLPKNYFCILRQFIFVGVLIGIFFSNGEGISLLPFPKSENIPTSAEQFSSQKKVFETFSIHNSSNAPTKAAFKYRKVLQNPFINFTFSWLFKRQEVLISLLQSENHFVSKPDFSTTCVLNFPSGRAPPFI